MDIAAIGRQFGLDESQTRAALDALAPVVAAGVRRTAQSPEGLQDILSSVLTGGHGRALEDEQAVAFDNAKVKGDDVLGQIFGNKDVSRDRARVRDLRCRFRYSEEAAPGDSNCGYGTSGQAARASQCTGRKQRRARGHSQ